MDDRREYSTRTGNDRLTTIDALRGCAALAVAWFHFTNGTPGFLADGILQSSGARGWLGVEVFFVISGFIIPYSLHKGGYLLRRHWRLFVAKRVIRLDPPYVACIVLVVALSYASAATPGFRGAPPHYTWTQLALHLGYLNAYIGGDWVNPVFWTLAIEFQFYLVIALVYPLLVHDRLSVRMGSIGLMVVASLLFPSTQLVFRWLGLFALGIVSFQLYVRLIDRRLYFVLLGALSVSCYMALGALVTAVGMATALILTFVRIRRTRFFSVLAAISYSVYLLHVPIGGRVINLGMRLAPTLLNRGLTLTMALAVTICASYLFYRLIELPAQRWSGSIRYTTPVSSPILSTEADLASAVPNRAAWQRFALTGSRASADST